MNLKNAIAMVFLSAGMSWAGDPTKPPVTLLCQALLSQKLVSGWKRPVELLSYPPVEALKAMVREMTDPGGSALEIYTTNDELPPLRGNILARGNYMDATLGQGHAWQTDRSEDLNFASVAQIIKRAHDGIYALAESPQAAMVSPVLVNSVGIRDYLVSLQRAIQAEFDSRTAAFRNMSPQERGRHSGYPGLKFGSLVGSGITLAMLVYAINAPPGLRGQRMGLFVLCLLVVVPSLQETAKYQRDYPRQYQDAVLASPVPFENEAKILGEFLDHSEELTRSGKSGDFVFASIPQTLYWSNPEGAGDPVATSGRAVLLTLRDSNNIPAHITFLTADAPEAVQKQIEMAQGIGAPVDQVLTFDGPTDFSAPHGLDRRVPVSRSDPMRIPVKILGIGGMALAATPPAYLIYQLLFGH